MGEILPERSKESELAEGISRSENTAHSGIKKHLTIAKNNEADVLNDRKQIVTIGNLFSNGFYEDDGIRRDNVLFVSRLSIVDLII